MSIFYFNSQIICYAVFDLDIREISIINKQYTTSKYEVVPLYLPTREIKGFSCSQSRIQRPLANIIYKQLRTKIIWKCTLVKVEPFEVNVTKALWGQFVNITHLR